jgi:hypothetical protein
MRALLALLLLLPGAARAGDPVFAPRPLPVEHVYSGGWEHFVGGGVAVLDCDADGYPDLFAAGGAGPARLFRNVTGRPGAPLAFDAAPLPGGLTDVTGAYPLDIDGDGWLDLFVLRAGANMALRGGPGCRFEDATAAWGLPAEARWSTAFSATWEPGEDRPTLAIGNYVDRTDPDGPFEACDDNMLLRPSGAGYAVSPLSPGYCALSMLFSDAMRRGRADLRISNDRHYYVRDGAEQMWRMPGPDLLGPEAGWAAVSIWGMGIASEDITGDGLPEVMLTSMGDQFLQYAEGGYRWRTAPYEVGATAHRPHVGDDGRPSTGWHAAFGDVDNDGLSDLFISKGNVDQMPSNAMRDPNSLLMQGADGRFTEVAEAAGVASMHRGRGAALADLNRDGRLDLAVVNRRAPMELWQNMTSGGNWIAVLPRQARPNGHAVGAWVELRRGDGAIAAREITVGGGHAGGTAGPVHFGLGTAEIAEIRVIWPDGAASEWTPLPVNRQTEIWRDGARLALSAPQ